MSLNSTDSCVWAGVPAVQRKFLENFAEYHGRMTFKSRITVGEESYRVSGDERLQPMLQETAEQYLERSKVIAASQPYRLRIDACGGQLGLPERKEPPLVAFSDLPLKPFVYYERGSRTANLPFLTPTCRYLSVSVLACNPTAYSSVLETSTKVCRLFDCEGKRVGKRVCRKRCSRVAK